MSVRGRVAAPDVVHVLEMWISYDKNINLELKRKTKNSKITYCVVLPHPLLLNARKQYFVSPYCNYRVCTLFQKQISRTFPGLRLIFQGLKHSHYPLQSLNSVDLNINSPYCHPYTSYFLVEFNRFQGLSKNQWPFSRTFQSWKMPKLSSRTFQVFQEPYKP